MQITVNAQEHSVDVDGDTPLLWVLRDTLGLTGPKYGCGIGACMACAVHIDGQSTPSCTLQVSSISGAVTTIEGLDSPVARAVKAAWIAHEVAQCGYCQGGQIMAATTLLTAKAAPTDSEIDEAMSGNICRCATYHRIRLAIHAAATALWQARA